MGEGAEMAGVDGGDAADGVPMAGETAVVWEEADGEGASDERGGVPVARLSEERPVVTEDVSPKAERWSSARSCAAGGVGW